MLELNFMKEVYNALIQRHSIVEESRDRNAKECKEKEMQIKELMIFKQKIESVTKQQSERIQTLKNELKAFKGEFFNLFFLKCFCFEDLFRILESKVNEIKELQNKLQIITKEHESCQKGAESREDQLDSAELEPVALEYLIEQEKDDSSEIIEESSLPEEKIQEKEKKKRFRSKRNLLKYKSKSIQVNRFKIFLELFNL
jgi:hypothetical protein